MKRPRKYDRPRTAVAWMAAILLVTGCAGGNRDVLDAEPDQITDDLHPADVDAPEVVPDDGAGQDPGNARPDEGESGDDYGNGSNCYEFFCDYSDFACLDEGTYYTREFYAHPEGDQCYTRPCGLSGPRKCQEGTLCYSRERSGFEDGLDVWNATGRPCRPMDCDEESGKFCDGFKFCDTLPGKCGGPGVCVNPNFPDHMTGPENGWQFVCGCDGITYSGWEQRARAATSVRGEGPCCDESKLNFTRDNAPGFSEFRVCMHGKLPSGLSASIKAVLDAATFGTAGEGAQCPEGDSAWVGKLTKAPDGSIDPDQFMALCRLADIGDQFAVTGHAEGFCESIPCYDKRKCVELYCLSPCGCCPCQANKLICGYNNETTICDEKAGCWRRGPECTEWAPCTDGEETDFCRIDCETMAWYLNNAATNPTSCFDDDDCVVMPAFCDPEDGPCWVPFGKYPEWYRDERDFAADWTSNCVDFESCGCGDRPAARCIGGTCRAG